MLKSINNSLFMSILALTYLLLRFVHCSSFVRLLFVFCSSSVRLLFVFCSSFVRLYVAVVPPLEGVRGRFSSSFLYLPVWLAPSFVRHLFVICSSFVRHLFVICSLFVRLLFGYSLFSYLSYYDLAPSFIW